MENLSWIHRPGISFSRSRCHNIQPRRLWSYRPTGKGNVSRHGQTVRVPASPTARGDVFSPSVSQSIPANQTTKIDRSDGLTHVPLSEWYGFSLAWLNSLDQSQLNTPSQLKGSIYRISFERSGHAES